MGLNLCVVLSIVSFDFLVETFGESFLRLFTNSMESTWNRFRRIKSNKLLVELVVLGHDTKEGS
jgi:hypothetical protein